MSDPEAQLGTAHAFRILVVALTTKSGGLKMDSATIVARDCIRDLTAAGHHVYVLLPDGAKEAGEWFAGDRVTIRYSDLPMQVHKLQYYLLDATALHRFIGTVGGQFKVDAAICFSPVQAMNLRPVLSSMNKDPDPPIFTFDLGQEWFDTSTQYDADNELYELDVFGYAQAWPLMSSKRGISVLLDRARFHGMGASLRERIASRAQICCPKLDLARIEEAKSEERFEKFTLLYAARINPAKNWEKIMVAYDGLYRQGHDLQVKMLSGTSGLAAYNRMKSSKAWGEMGYIDPVLGADQDTFFWHAARSHVYAVWSYSEAYCSALGEAALLGCVPMVHRSSWATSLLADKLPEQMWFSNKAEMQAKILWVRDHWTTAQDMIKPVAEMYAKRSQEDHLGVVVPRSIERDSVERFRDSRVRETFMPPLRAWLRDLAERTVKQKQSLMIPLEKVHVSMGDYVFSAGAMANSDVDRWARGRAIITDWGIYKALKYELGLVDRTDMSANVFELTVERASEIIEEQADQPSD